MFFVFLSMCLRASFYGVCVCGLQFERFKSAGLMKDKRGITKRLEGNNAPENSL